MPTFEARIAANGDDGAWQNGTSPPDITTGGNILVGSSASPPAFAWNLTLHYPNVTIPSGTTITVAFLRFQSNNADSGSPILTNVFGIDEDNPVAPTTVPQAEGKALTAGVAWDNIPAWSVDEEGPDTTTPSLVAQVQTIIDRAGWASGNAMEFQIRDDGTVGANVLRRPKSNGDPVGTKSLVHIEYSGLGTILRSFAAPADNPRGITFDGRSLWLTDSLTDLIYQLDPRDGTVLKSFATPADNPTGITFDGRSLWLCDTGADLIYQLDPRDGTVLKSFATPDSTGIDLAFDGRSLWHTDFLTNLIYQLDPRDGTVLKSFATPTTNAWGVTFDGHHLWAVDFASRLIYELDPVTGTTIRSFAAPGAEPRGLGFGGRTLWHCDSATGLIYQLSM
jgi:outer membrane protein assembly factor BamB